LPPRRCSDRVRRLAGVEIGGAALGTYNDGSMIDVFPVHHDGHRVGQVTSACHSPRLEKNIGYAMVPTELSEPGTELQIDTGQGLVDAVVVPKPFIDPTKVQPKTDVRGLASPEAPLAGTVADGDGAAWPRQRTGERDHRARPPARSSR